MMMMIVVWLSAGINCIMYVMNMSLTWYHFLSPYPIHAHFGGPSFLLGPRLSLSWNLRTRNPIPFSTSGPRRLPPIVAHREIHPDNDLTHLHPSVRPSDIYCPPDLARTRPTTVQCRCHSSWLFWSWAVCSKGPGPEEHFGPLIITIFCIKLFFKKITSFTFWTSAVSVCVLFFYRSIRYFHHTSQNCTVKEHPQTLKGALSLECCNLAFSCGTEVP